MSFYSLLELPLTRPDPQETWADHESDVGDEYYTDAETLEIVSDREVMEDISSGLAEYKQGAYEVLNR